MDQLIKTIRFKAQQKIAGCLALTSDQREQAMHEIKQLTADAPLTDAKRFRIRKVLVISHFQNLIANGQMSVKKVPLSDFDQEQTFKRFSELLVDGTHRLQQTKDSAALKIERISSENLAQATLDNLISDTRFKLIQHVQKHAQDLQKKTKRTEAEKQVISGHQNDLVNQLRLDTDLENLLSDYHQGIQELDTVLDEKHIDIQAIQKVSKLIDQLRKLISVQDNYPESYRDYDLYVLSQRQNELYQEIKDLNDRNDLVWAKDVEQQLRHFVLSEFGKYYLVQLKSVEDVLRSDIYASLKKQVEFIQTSFDANDLTLPEALKQLRIKVGHPVAKKVNLRIRKRILGRLTHYRQKTQLQLGKLATGKVWDAFEETAEKASTKLLETPISKLDSQVKQVYAQLQDHVNKIIYEHGLKSMNDLMQRLIKQLKDSPELNQKELHQAISQMEYEYHRNLHVLSTQKDADAAKNTAKLGMQHLRSVYKQTLTSVSKKRDTIKAIQQYIHKTQKKIDQLQHLTADQKKVGYQLLERLGSQVNVRPLTTESQLLKKQKATEQLIDKVFNKVMTANVLVDAMQAADLRINQSQLPSDEKQKLLKAMEQILQSGAKL